MFKSSLAAHQNIKHIEMHHSLPKSVFHVRSCFENTTQETASSSKMYGTDNDNILKSLAASNEANDLELHSSKGPIVIQIKEEEDI